MAQLAVGVAGAIIGSAFGQPALGFAAGSAIGGLLSGVLFPEKTTGSSSDAAQFISSSAWGAPIPLLYGTARLPGNMIWCGPVKQTTQTSNASGGKGGSSAASQSTSSVNYSCSFAMGFCAGVMDSVLRIWGNGTLLYDQTNPSQVIEGGITFYFHAGNETDTPEPYIEDWVSKNVPDASGAAPAFRGLCYIMFPDMLLAPFGNVLPSITAEITSQAQYSPSLTQWSNIEPAPVVSTSTDDRVFGEGSGADGSSA